MWLPSPAFALPDSAGGVDLRGVLPMDAVPGATWTCCYGVAALTRNWMNGPLFDVIAGGNTNTIYAKNGYPDVKRLAVLMGIDSESGIKGLLISKWHDQSGNEWHATQAATARQPAVWLVDGAVYVFFGGILSTNAQKRLSPQFLTIPAGASINSQSFSAYSIFKPYTSSVAVSGAHKFSTLFSANGNPSFLFAYPSTFGGGTPRGFLIDLTTFSSAGLAAPNIGMQQSVVSAFGTANETAFGINGSSATARAMTAATYSGGNLGCDQSASGIFPNGASGRMQCFLLSSTQFSSTQRSQIGNALYQWGNVQGSLAASAKVNVVIDGASFDQGQGGDASGLYAKQNGGGYGWGEILQDELRGHAIQWNNVAGSGNTIANCTSNYAPITSGCFNASAAINIIIGPNSAYGNSINPAIGKRTGAQAYSDFQAWLTAVKVNSWTRILCLIFPDRSMQGAAYNSLMIANAATNGVTLINMSNNVAHRGLPYLNPDGHPTIAGSRLIAGNVFSYLQPLL